MAVVVRPHLPVSYWKPCALRCAPSPSERVKPLMSMIRLEMRGNQIRRMRIHSGIVGNIYEPFLIKSLCGEVAVQ